ncbi:MAG: helix-turn-helix transcriptional regulator [Oscillospiraceae bacterium]|nr:helix-turn-helix transcriptional regulator [Oscillospiraceae bacterium]
MKLNYKKELTPVVYGESPVRILSISFDENHPGFPQHWHERIELHLIKKGILKLNCNGEEVEVKEGELSIVSPSFVHSGKSGASVIEYYVIMFDIEDMYNGTLSVRSKLEKILKGEVCFKAKTDVPEIVELAKEIVETNADAECRNALETAGNLYKLLGLLCRHCIDEKCSGEINHGKFENVIEYINANYMKDISVGSISEKFNYDEAYFCRKFKSETGMTAAKYIKIQRLERARYLLEKKEISVKKIALSCGFHDSAYFINCFRAMYGASPLQYCRMHRMGNS